MNIAYFRFFIVLCIISLFGVSACTDHKSDDRWENVTSTFFPNKGASADMQVYKLAVTSPDTLIAHYVKFKPNASRYAVEVLTSDSLSTLSSFLEHEERVGNNVVLMINGGYFSIQEYYSVSMSIHDGRLVEKGADTMRRNGNKYLAPRGAVAFNYEGQPSIQWAYARENVSWYAEQNIPNYDTAPPVEWVQGVERKEVEEALGAGPLLLKHGKMPDYRHEILSQSLIYKKHPRTAIGITRDGELVILMVEGRKKMSKGVTCKELAEMFLELGCVDALNLDGGGSSYAYLNGKPLMVSSDGKERPVRNVIAFLQK